MIIVFVRSYSFTRLINEKLYKSDSSEAVKMIKEDPKVFQDVSDVSTVFYSEPRSIGPSTMLVSDIRYNPGPLTQSPITSMSSRNILPSRSL